MSHALPGGGAVLLEVSTGKRYPLRGIQRFVVGRSQQANLPVLDMSCSRQQFCVETQGERYLLQPLSERSPTYCNGQPVRQAVPLTHGAAIRAGASEFRFLEREPSASFPPRAAGAVTAAPPSAPLPPAGDNRTILAGAGAAMPAAELTGRFVLVGQMLIGREAPRAQILLAHPQVSRVHAQITLQQPGAAVLSDLNSANGTFVNGRRLTTPVRIRRGDQIDIGPYCLVFDGEALLPSSRANNVELMCRNVSRVVTDRTTGQPLKLLDDITLVIRPKEMVCLLGPSGSGKSTLLSALSARVPADEGSVTINGEDFYRSFDALKHDVAVVPQKDVLHDRLSLLSALRYTARLRLPPDTSRQERDACIDEMLSTVGLSERRETRIQHLSGGQIKRASLANEILSKPSLLFLDEVTSGLDEQTDRDMMQLFRRIADSGKTVVCITHSLANVERTCNLVVVLTAGGKLAFVGPPAEALGYFQIERLGDVYERLAQKPADAWKEQFRAHPLFVRYVRSRLPAVGQPERAPSPRQTPTFKDRVQLFFHQCRILSGRYLRIQLADQRALAMMFGQCLLVAVLLSLLFGNLEKKNFFEAAKQSPTLLFLMAVSCLWFGCNNAAKEIVKERLIYSRERDVNLLVSSYYASKVVLLGAWTVLQVVVLFGIVKTCTQLSGSGLGQLVFLATLSLVGVTLGLFISAISKSDDMAVTLVPIVLIPQIALAGVVAPVEGLAKLLAQLAITTYWGYRGLATLLPENMTHAIGSHDWSTTGAFSLLALHALLFAIAALGFLMFGEGGGRGAYGKGIDQWLASAAARLSRTVQALDN